MEKGKRIEFKGVAKIVILAIVILMTTGITAIEATGFRVGDCPDCSESGLALTSSQDYPTYLQCFYYSSDIPSIENADGRIYVHEYSSAERATNAFKDMCQYYQSSTQNAEKILSSDDTKFVYMVYSEEFPDIQIHGYFFHSDGNVIIEVSIYTNTFVCAIDSEITKAKKRFDEFAKCAHSITGWEYVPVLPEAKEEYTLTLKHYPPYYKPGKDDIRRAGDLVATLTDKEGKGVSGKDVFFYLEDDDTRLDEVLVPRTVYPSGGYHYVFDQFIHPITGGSYIGYDLDTGGDGKVYSEYISRFRPETLSEIIRDGGDGKGTITAVVFNEKLTAIEQEASVSVELSSVARITEVISLNSNTKDKANVSVTRDGKETEDVYDRNNIPKGGLPTGARCTPYDLLCDDVIFLDESDYIKVHWLTGTRMTIQPKAGFLKKNEYAEVGITGTDVGWYSEVTQSVNSLILGASLTGGGLYLTLSGASIPAGVIAGIPGIFILGWNVHGYFFEPLIIQPYSTILIDFDETATVYTVEGTGRLYNKDNSTTNVTTGHKMSVSPDGTFSQVSKFDRSELSEELSYLLESIEKDESGITSAPVLTPEKSKLEISKLYVGKSVYPRETEVDVHYNVKNIGTVDVDEYHVEYKINDFKGNEVYKFVGSTHSIASGKQQKFVAAEKWKIPSDARIGPYIINCALIWGSKRDTAGSEFFVTHPANHEDRTAELEISNLYTGKSEYLKGAGEIVDVCYYVKNTGTVDISEYHVIYQIFDSEGKRYCWFISDMFGSIVAGKEDKWQSGVWKVPSDAKVGRYTVEAMVIWGLDHFSRETVYFFVK